jgi:hypothetical protein
MAIHPAGKAMKELKIQIHVTILFIYWLFNFQIGEEMFLCNNFAIMPCE